ncbi:MAG TPA: TIGR03557 family F420-dependent LLM class oxidoreductase [Thermomicrobiales bacterium]|jgi:G6PDH family F420-dependent oxidoreductase|nr:TIGR03557 family F420-dependent LLM class oxidoreductase [Thermomicrobiales bacterium]
MRIGYTMMCEQRSPRDLVRDIVAAEQAGFEFSVISDHYHPWVEGQGHSPYAWSVLGAAAQATERIGLMTYVTAPIMRYHPAVVAQKAATMALLSDGRFRLGLGAGENLNEHVVGQGWPAVDIRHEMLAEAVEIIAELFSGEYVTYRGDHFDVESAKLFDLPETPVPIGLAISGPDSAELAAEYAGMMIATQPDAQLIKLFQNAGGEGSSSGQMMISWGPDEAAQRKLAHDNFGWTAGGWKIQAELPGPVNFQAFVDVVPEETVVENIVCGPDVDQIVEQAKKWADAGFDELALVQLGDTQAEFCEFYKRELGPRLAKL